MSQYRAKLIQKLKHFKIPESEYSFSGGLPNNCLCVEKKEDVWEVYYSNSKEKTVRGIFYNENTAYDFLFYLVVKKHINIKKRWW